MKILLIATLSLLSLPAFAKVNCVAVSQSTDGKTRTEAKLAQTYDSVDLQKWEADLGANNFTVTFDKANDDYLLMITKGPAYEDGIALRGAFNKKHELKGSLVSPVQVLQIICSDL